MSGGRRNGLPWHAGLPPVTVEVEWPDACHRITWRAGKLLLDHHRDLAAEKVFAALGGERCPCLDVLEAWGHWQADPNVLRAWGEDWGGSPGMVFGGPRPPGSAAGPSTVSAQDVMRQVRARMQAIPGRLVGPPGSVAVSGGVSVSFATVHPPGPPSRRGQPPQVSAQHLQQVQAQLEEQHRQMWRDVLLWALPQDLRDRLMFSALVGAARRRSEEWHRWKRAVEEATSSRAVPGVHESIRFWRGRVGSGPRRPTVEAWVTFPGEAATLYGLVDKAGGWAAATLPDTWLVDVWARGLAVVEGSFVLEVTGWEEHPDRLQVTAARWERRLGEGSTPVIEPAVVVPRGPDGWTLRWL